MTNEHVPNCDCYDCNHLISGNIQGLYLYSKKPLFIYKEPGGALIRTIQPVKVDDKSSPYFGRIAMPSGGKILAISNNKRWVHTAKGWIFNTNDLYTQTGDMNAFGEVSKLTPKEIENIVNKSKLAALGASNPAAALGIATVETVKDVGESVMEFIPKFKWVIISVIVILLLILFIKIK